MKATVDWCDSWYCIKLIPETVEEAAELVLMDLNMTKKTSHQLICDRQDVREEPMSLRLFNEHRKEMRFVRSDA